MQEIGKYKIEEELGRGGMGLVYKAFDPFNIDGKKMFRIPSWEKPAVEYWSDDILFQRPKTPLLLSFKEFSLRNEILYQVFMNSLERKICFERF